MTEGEKKAIEYLKENSLVKLNENNEIIAYGNAHKYYIINLIEKLQKENELRRKDYIELHKIANDRRVEIMELEENSLTIKQVKENFIPKDKIREKIEEYRNEIECEKSYLEQGIICEEEYKDRVKVYNSYIFILNKLLEEE